MFSRFSFQQQRDLEAFLGIPPEFNSGPCDKHLPVIPVVENSQPQEPAEIAYHYKYNPDMGDVEYSSPKK